MSCDVILRVYGIYVFCFSLYVFFFFVYGFLNDLLVCSMVAEQVFW